jgi:hypothetical protein
MEQNETGNSLNDAMRRRSNFIVAGQPCLASKQGRTSQERTALLAHAGGLHEAMRRKA